MCFARMAEPIIDNSSLKLNRLFFIIIHQNKNIDQKKLNTYSYLHKKSIYLCNFSVVVISRLKNQYFQKSTDIKWIVSSVLAINKRTVPFSSQHLCDQHFLPPKTSQRDQNPSHFDPKPHRLNLTTTDAYVEKKVAKTC